FGAQVDGAAFGFHAEFAGGDFHDGAAGDAWQDGTRVRGEQFAAAGGGNDDVGGAGLFQVAVFGGVQVQGFVSAQFLGLARGEQAAGVVGAGLDVAQAVRGGAVEVAHRQG